MKKKVLTAFIVMFFSLAANAQDNSIPATQDHYWIDSLKIIPQEANAGDIISVVAYTTHPSGGCDLQDYKVWKCNQFVFVDATYEQGMLTYICHSVDTLRLGTFTPGSYFLIFDWLDTISFRVYPNQEDCQAYFTYFYAKCLDAKCINTVAFQDSSKGDVVSWFWEFGDGTVSKEKNPVHTYTNRGVYCVCLKIATSDGCTSTYCERVPVGQTERCKADFKWEPLHCFDSFAPCPRSFYFNDLSKGDPIKWYWHFGDGDTSTFQNPVHTYPCNGRYFVSLVIVTSSGCSDIELDTIVIGDTSIPCCQADFDWEEVIPFWDCQKKSTDCITPYYYVQFTDQSSLNTVEWLWSFGDGDTSIIRNPQHNYYWLPGNPFFKVCLKIKTSDHCVDTICKMYDPQNGSLVSGSDDVSQSPEELTLFPNPASGEIHVLLPKDLLNKECLLTIMDMYGRQLGMYSYEKGETVDGTVSLNVANLINGQYICTVKADNKLFKSRFAVTK